MCKPGETCSILVRIPEDLSASGFPKVKYAKIDKCIAPLVEALQRGGIDMRASCCGHGKGDGKIFLQDGRFLIIKRGGLDMSDEKIKVTAEHFGAKLDVYPTAILIKMEKDGFETSVKIPVGDKVSSKRFALAVKALFQATTVFHHRVYDRLREKMEDLNKGFEKEPAILEKDQRGG